MKREIYNTLCDWKNTKINTPLMIIGARQIGKTYAIREFLKNEFNHYIEVNLFERSDIVEIFEKSISFKDKMILFEAAVEENITEDSVIFFDEIQESEGLISNLKQMQESKFPYKIICAGSLLGVKIKRFSKSFPVGKVIMENMYPMNFKEFLWAMNVEAYISLIEECYANNTKMDETIHEKLLYFYRVYLCTGGLPFNILQLINNDKNINKVSDKYLKDMEIEYIADMTKYVDNKMESTKIELIYESIVSQLSKEYKKFQYSIINKNARMRDYNTALSWLISSRLIIPVYYVSEGIIPLKASQRQDVFKAYSFDTGILRTKANIVIEDMILNKPFRFKGALTENYCVDELVSKNYKLYYWAEPSKAEIDLIIEKEGKVIPIEIKAGENNKSKSLMMYKDKYKIDLAIRISANNFGIKDGIKSVPLYAVFCI